MASNHLTVPKPAISAEMIVYLQPTGNAALRWNGSPLVGKVTAVRRKYFYVQLDRDSSVIPIALDSFVSKDEDTNSGYLVFPSLPSFMQAQEKEQLCKEIHSAWERCNFGKKLSFKAVKQIHNLLAAESFIQATSNRKG